MKKPGKLTNLFIRYLLALFLGIFFLFETSFNIFYIIFTPLTIYPVYAFLSLFYPVALSGTSLIIQTATIALVPACIAGSAYYLLLILNLLTPIAFKTRIKALLFSYLVLLIINILRIILFSTLFIKGFQYFDLAHWLFWYALSIVFVFLIWIAEIKIYKIKNIPFYTDFKYLLSLTKKTKTSKRNKNKVPV